MMRPLLALLALLSLSTVFMPPGFATPSSGAEETVEESDAPAVVPEPSTPTVARDVGVADLPLLVDEPPQEQDEQPAIPDPVIGGEDSGFNPFAPLVLPQQPSEEAPPAEAETPEAAPETSASETTPQATPAPAAPVFPTAPAPEARVSRSSIPNALTARMTPPSVATRSAAPGILETAIGTQTSSLSDVSGTSIAVRTPSLPPLIAAPAMVGTTPYGARQVAARPSVPQGVTKGITPMTFAGTMLGYDENATSAVSNRVSRSLSTLRVSFTAMSTGTGVFHVGDSVKPVLLAVGERLPGTRLTLSRLTAQSAQFLEDDVRHTLLLNP